MSSTTDSVNWRELTRWGTVVATAVVVSFWLARIDTAVAAIQVDVSEIKGSLGEHVKLPAHPVTEVRLKALEAK